MKKDLRCLLHDVMKLISTIHGRTCHFDIIKSGDILEINILLDNKIIYQRTFSVGDEKSGIDIDNTILEYAISELTYYGIEMLISQNK